MSNKFSLPFLNYEVIHMSHNLIYNSSFSLPRALMKSSGKNLSRKIEQIQSEIDMDQMMLKKIFILDGLTSMKLNENKKTLKFLNIGKFLRSSCQKSKIMPSDKIWVQTHNLESSNRIQRLEIMEWEKLPLASKFFKTFGTIVISIQRSSGFSIFIP